MLHKTHFQKVKMSKKENLMKFWESVENNQRGQSGRERRDSSSSVIPQKLVIDRILTQKLPECLEKKLTVAERSGMEEQGSSSACVHTEDNGLPHLPRNEILINTTKTRARRGKSSKSVEVSEEKRKVEKVPPPPRSDQLPLTPPAAASEFSEKDSRFSNHLAGMLLSKISPRQLKPKPVPSDNQNQTPEFIKYDLARQHLDAEFREKIAKKAAPNTFPKPVVTPRRSSLQFSRDHFRGFSENTEHARSSRKSVGDIFGERMTAKKSDPGQGLVREISCGDHRAMLRSQTWVKDQTRPRGSEEKKEVGLVNRELIKTIKAEIEIEFSERISKLERDLETEKVLRSRLEMELRDLRLFCNKERDV